MTHEKAYRTFRCKCLHVSVNDKYKNMWLHQQRCLRIWLDVDTLSSVCFKYITWKIINHWFLEMATLVWTSMQGILHSDYISFSYLFFFLNLFPALRRNWHRMLMKWDLIFQSRCVTAEHQKAPRFHRTKF